ncbi:hypothetical protein G3I32_13090 [Streptomyces coelicoflavus]|uniref:Uncharacterized protein n=1 Tax=Streptomyces coelicoflavus TaxID=285562 RepID=A0A7K3PIR6_9ACTN|nr:hypothetical protein [Streptomyces coelicoflavus]NEB09787.1 hypothetical protein [Streptomyces coelicoflavus]
MTPPSTEIALSTSAALGLVAIAVGENYQKANQAIEAAGLTRQPGGAYAVPLTDPKAARRAASALAAHGHEHGIALVTSTRRYLGDVGTEIAAQLPGNWSAQLEIYSLPLWQDDLWCQLWEAGEIHAALQNHNVPFASVLKDGQGTELLLMERPGHSSGYLLGALTDHEKEDVLEDPTTPSTMVLPAEPDRAAALIAGTFLPLYRNAVHHRDLNFVLAALERIRGEHRRLQGMKESGHYADGVPLSGRITDALERSFTDLAWIQFRTVADLAPDLIARCDPGSSPWPGDQAAVVRLRSALADSEATMREYTTLNDDLHQLRRLLQTHEYHHVRAEFGLSARPAIETWLADSAAFERQVRAAKPARPTALASSSQRALTSRPVPPPAAPAPTVHR